MVCQRVGGGVSWPGDQAALRRNNRSVTANTTAKLDDFTIRCDCTGGAITVALPLAADAFGQILVIKKIDASGNSATIDPNGTELIDGGASVAIGTQNETKIIQSNGTSWDILF